MEHIREQIRKGMENKIISDICDEMKNVFGNYYYFVLSLVVEEFELILKIYQQCHIKVNEEFFAKQFFGDLYQELANCTVPVLVVEIHKWKLEENKAEQDLYNSFSEMLLEEEFIVELYNKYPELYKLSKEIINNRVKYIREVTQNFIEDYQELKKTFGGNKELGELLYIKITDGDSHNNGKKVALLVLEDRKIVYKPHHLKSDEFFYHMLKNMNNFSKVKNSNYIPKYVCKEDHGWQEFLMNISCTKDEEVSRYYYRLGVLLCNCYILNCGDIHYENLIANGEYPIIIDLETLVHVKHSKLKQKGMAVKVIEEYNNSVLGTMILPTNFVFSTFDFDISGIGGGVAKQSDSWNAYSLQNLGTNEIQFKKESFVRNNADNCVMLEKKVVSALKYSDQILQGFEDAYQYVLENKEEIVQFFKQADFTIRQVLRPTAVYARILGTSYYNEYYTSEERRMKLFKKLEINMDESDKNRVNSEIDSFVKNDIPYFLCKWNDTDLYDGHNRLLEKDYFENTPLDVVLEKLAQISNADLEKQLYYIKLGLSTITFDDGEMKSIMRGKNITAKNSYISIAQEIAEEIASKIVWSDENVCNMLTVDTLNERRVVSYLGIELYESGGIPLFFAQIGKLLDNDKYKRIAKGLLLGIEEMKVSETLKGASLFTGKISLAYIYYQFYVLFGENSYLEKCENLVKEIDVNECKGYDIISGVSSSIIILLNLYDVLKEQWIFDKAHALGEHLLEELASTDGQMYTGLAHGASGPAWALISLGNKCREEAFTMKGMELLEYEEQYYDEEVNNWKDIREDVSTENIAYWCYGAGGIGLSRMKMSDCLQDRHIQLGISHAVSRLKQKDRIENHSLCHGEMGKIDIMNLFVKKGLLEKEILQERVDAVLAHIEKEGLISGKKECLADYSFMNGLAGIGYTFLRLYNSDIPSVLALEV